MKQANNNEVDLLLRALARDRISAARQSGSERGDAKQVSSAHLDPDELNSYAEGVAPDPARARYTEHLADCEACRGIVVSLVQSAGTASRLEIPEQKGHAGFWQKLRELFSPSVLGYAVPALVLTAVIGIGWLALRQQRVQFVAQNEGQRVAPPVAQNKTDSALNSAAQPQASVQNGIKPGTTTEPPKEKTALEDEKLRGLLKPESEFAKAAPAKDAAEPAEVGSVAGSRPYAPEPKSAEAPPPAPVVNTEKSAELARERSEKREDQPRDQDEAFRVQKDDVHGPNRSRSNTAQPMSQRGAGVGTAAARGPSADKNKKGADVETRSVMGRHFTREGDAWVDTAYEYSQATVRVTRGSDQFRALVADEPAIRTIAAQLNGVVIVVWKNRAYRIQ